MTPGWLIPALVAAALAVALVGALARARRWGAGRPARVALLGGLAALPKRYLVDLHGGGARDRFAAAMHLLAAGGLVASLVLLPIVHLPGLETRVLAWALLAALAALIAGAALAALRRLGGAECVIGPRPEVKDVAELLLAAVGGLRTPPPRPRRGDRRRRG